MSEPKIPSPTCPTINHAIGHVKDLKTCDEGDREWNAHAAIDCMEEVRTANEQLRAAVVYWQELAGDRLMRIEQLEEKVDSLEADLAEADGGK